jgi:hypothetical protein
MKQARIVLKYEYFVDAETLGLPKNVSNKDFRKAVYADTDIFLDKIESVTGMVPDEIETDFEGVE